MNGPRKSAEEVAREIADALEARGIDYAVGGAICLGQWGVVRATTDADFNIWVDPAKPTAAAHLIGQLGGEFKASAVIREFTDKGWAWARFHGVHVDFYLPTKDFHESVRARRRKRPLLGRDAWFLSAEDLAVFKLIIFRLSDMGDLSRLLVIRGRDLDRAYVRDWIGRLCGAHDLRVKRWDELVQETEPAVAERENGWIPPHLRD